ncbi:MAG: MBL fold metallo-hydrolase [Euryarchaeota archaeon]|nr:MBL fold metallo-hydrolase [Euryarchaeota archaeon]
MEIVPIVSTEYDSNVYVVIAERVAVIDTGLSASRLEQKLRGVIAPERVDYVINTHAHIDHCGGNPLFSRAEVLVHELDAGAMSDGSFYGTSSLFSSTGRMRCHRVLREGDSIDLGGAELEVLHTPGHTPGSICLYIASEGALFSGDTLFAGGSFGRADLGGNMEHLKRSLRRLAALEIEALYPGHMEVVKGREARESARLAWEIAEEYY